MLRRTRVRVCVTASFFLFLACSSDSAETDPTPSPDGEAPDTSTPDASAPDAPIDAPTGDGAPLSSCTDLVKNGDETDVDCGGSCAKCATGKACAAPADCALDICADAICQVFTTPLRVDDPTGGPLSIRRPRIFDDADGTPVVLYEQTTSAQTSLRLYARAFVNGTWEATPARLDTATEDPSHSFLKDAAVKVVGTSAFVAFTSNNGMYVARRHGGSFQAAAMVHAGINDGYLAVNGTDLVALAEATTNAAEHVAASSWNGTAFPASSFVETTGDRASFDPSQDIFEYDQRWNGWIVFAGNLTTGARRGLFASRWSGGAWSTAQPVDVPTDDAISTSPIRILNGNGGASVIAFLQRSGGVLRLRVNRIADGASDWAGAVDVSPVEFASGAYDYKLASLDGTPGDVTVAGVDDARTHIYASRGTGSTWTEASNIAPAGATGLYLGGLERLEEATGALACFVGTFAGEREAWVVAFQNGAWATPVPILPLGTGGANYCTLLPGNRIVLNSTSDGATVERVARWTSSGLSAVTPLLAGEPTFFLSLLRATANHPARALFYTETEPRRLFVADWPDSGIQAPTRLDNAPTGVDYSVVGTTFANGKQGFLYREAGGTQGLYAVFGH